MHRSTMLVIVAAALYSTPTLPQSYPTRAIRVIIPAAPADSCDVLSRLPTIAETLPGFESGGWFGIIGPAALPKTIVAVLNQEVNRALTAPDVREKLAAFGLEVHTESPEYFTDVIRRDFEKWGKLARDIGFKPR